MQGRLRNITFGIAAGLLMLAVIPVAFGHIRIYPMQSTFGAREKYTMRVPNERQSPTIRVEGEFPPGLDVYDFEFKPGWKIDFKKDEKGKIVGATWTGRIAPYEFVEFGMLAINPKSGNSSLLWKFYQYYEDGFKEEFTAPPDAKMPLRPMPEVKLSSEGAAVAPSYIWPSRGASLNVFAKPAPAYPPSAPPDDKQDALIAKGKERFKAYQCGDCHGENGQGVPDGDAPDLTHSKRTAEEVSKFLAKPSPDAEAKGMPDVPVDSPDHAPLVAYVMSIRAK